MTISIYANPYSYNATGFYFESIEDYNDKYEKNFEKYHCEEYEFDFIDGDEILEILFTTLGNCQVMKILELYEDGEIDCVHKARQLEVCMNVLGMDIDDALNNYEDIYLFEGTKRDYAYDSFPWHDIPEYLHSYVDIEQYVTDLECGGDITDLGNGYIYIR